MKEEVVDGITISKTVSPQWRKDAKRQTIIAP